MPTQEELFMQLIDAAGTLATVTDNAAVILSEQFEEMVRPQIDAVRDIISQCPAPVDQTWMGSFEENHIIETTYRSYKGDGAPGHGVKLVHTPTGIGRQSESKSTEEENRSVARKALAQAVAREWERRGR